MKPDPIETRRNLATAEQGAAAASHGKPNSSDRADVLAEQSNLTSAQLLIWMGQKLAPGRPIYNMAMTFRFAGAVDADAFSQAFDRLVAQSDAMRTVITETDGVPQAAVRPSVESPLHIVDLAHEPDAEDASDAWVQQRCKQPFNLGRCLYDSALIRLSADAYIWYLNQHHLITDGWSKAATYQYMADLYAATLANSAEHAEPIPTFADYATFERKQRSAPSAERSRAYWQARTDPLDRPTQFYGCGPAETASQTVRVHRELGRDRTARLNALAEADPVRAFSHDLALSQVLQTVLFAYLYRIDGRASQCIGTPFHHRVKAAHRRIPGLFMEVFPSQVTIGNDETFLSLLGKVKVESQNSLRHARPGVGNTRMHHGYDVMLNFVNASFPPFNGLPVRCRWLHAHHGESRHRLQIQIHDFDQSGSLQLHFDVNEQALSTEARRWVGDHFIAMLDAFIADPNQRIDQANLLSDSERHAAITRFNDTAAEYARDRSVVELFEQSVAQYPHDHAVVCEGSAVTYFELNARAEAIARVLQSRDIGPGNVVAICAKRSIGLVASALGVLKAGAAYTPIDPKLPTERIGYMLDDSDAAATLIQTGLESALPQRLRDSAIFINHDATDLPDAVDTVYSSPLPIAPPQDLAYVIYTSGSSGFPKGVMVEHRNLVNYLSWAKRAYVGDSRPAMALYTSVSFDLTVTSLLLPLISGGQVVVYPEDDSGVDTAFLRVLDEDAVDLLKATPAHLSLLVGRDQNASRVRKLIVGGDALTRHVALRAQSVFGSQAEICNEYGPTEATVGCMIHRFNAATDADASVPIGVPADNCQIYLLDRNLNPVPTGVAGEMFICGDSVTRGYLNQPILTGKRFLECPFQHGHKMYRTGDLARRDSNGLVTFIGRTDHQVKVRGVRVEPGEIEAALATHPGIRECVVITIDAPRTEHHTDTRGADTGEKRLAAYFTATEPIPTSQLRTYLLDKLPDYMVPSYFTEVNQIPLSNSGKVDREALPVPSQQSATPDKDYKAPDTDVERLLAEIWARALGVDRVGRHDNFFDLGGDSIVNLQIVAGAHQVGLSITPSQVFEHATIAGLAGVAGEPTFAQAPQGQVTGDVLFAPIQRWWLDQAPPAAEHWNMVCTVELHEPVDADALERALVALMSHHDALRLEVNLAAARARQTITRNSGDVVLSRLDFSGMSAKDQDAAMESALSDAHQRMSLTDGRLVQAALVRLGPARRDRLLLAIHHIAVDGVSWQILLEDIESTYRLISKGSDPLLPRKTTSYQQWSNQLTQQVSRNTNAVKYWAHAVSQPDSGRIPVDTATAVPPTENSTQVESVSLTKDATAGLLCNTGTRARATAQDMILAAVTQALMRWVGRDRLTLDVEGHGRDDLAGAVNVSRTVGWFTAIYPVLIERPASSDRSAADSLLDATRSAIANVPDGGVGYGVLRYLNGEPALPEHAKPDALFNYLGELERLANGRTLFQLAAPLALSRGPENVRPYRIEINAWVFKGSLRINWSYSHEEYRRETILDVAKSSIDALRALIQAACDDQQRPAASDFPLAGLDAKQFSKLAQTLDDNDVVRDSQE